MEPRAVDYDNDGDLDLFFHDHLAQRAWQSRPIAISQRRKLEFYDVTAAEGSQFDTMRVPSTAPGAISTSTAIRISLRRPTAR